MCVCVKAEYQLFKADTFLGNHVHSNLNQLINDKNYNDLNIYPVTLL